MRKMPFGPPPPRSGAPVVGKPPAGAGTIGHLPQQKAAKLLADMRRRYLLAVVSVACVLLVAAICLFHRLYANALQTRQSAIRKLTGELVATELSLETETQARVLHEKKAKDAESELAAEKQKTSSLLADQQHAEATLSAYSDLVQVLVGLPKSLFASRLGPESFPQVSWAQDPQDEDQQRIAKAWQEHFDLLRARCRQANAAGAAPAVANALDVLCEIYQKMGVSCSQMDESVKSQLAKRIADVVLSNELPQDPVVELLIARAFELLGRFGEANSHLARAGVEDASIADLPLLLRDQYGATIHGLLTASITSPLSSIDGRAAERIYRYLIDDNCPLDTTARSQLLYQFATFRLVSITRKPLECKSPSQVVELRQAQASADRAALLVSEQDDESSRQFVADCKIVAAVVDEINGDFADAQIRLRSARDSSSDSNWNLHDIRVEIRKMRQTGVSPPDFERRLPEIGESPGARLAKSMLLAMEDRREESVRSLSQLLESLREASDPQLFPEGIVSFFARRELHHYLDVAVRHAYATVDTLEKESAKGTSDIQDLKTQLSKTTEELTAARERNELVQKDLDAKSKKLGELTSTHDACLEDLRRLNRDNATQFLLTPGRDYIRKGKLDEAKDVLTAAIMLDDQNAVFFYLRGICHYLQGNKEDAETDGRRGRDFEERMRRDQPSIEDQIRATISNDLDVLPTEATDVRAWIVELRRPIETR